MNRARFNAVSGMRPFGVRGELGLGEWLYLKNMMPHHGLLRRVPALTAPTDSFAFERNDEQYVCGVYEDVTGPALDGIGAASVVGGQSRLYVATNTDLLLRSSAGWVNLTPTYTTGTVTVNNGSTSVAGAGTAWLTSLIGSLGALIQLQGMWYKVAAISSNIALTITTPYQGTNLAGAAYTVRRGWLTPWPSRIFFASLLGDLYVCGSLSWSSYLRSGATIPDFAVLKVPQGTDPLFSPTAPASYVAAGVTAPVVGVDVLGYHFYPTGFSALADGRLLASGSWVTNLSSGKSRVIYSSHLSPAVWSAAPAGFNDINLLDGAITAQGAVRSAIAIHMTDGIVVGEPTGLDDPPLAFRLSSCKFGAAAAGLVAPAKGLGGQVFVGRDAVLRVFDGESDRIVAPLTKAWPGESDAAAGSYSGEAGSGIIVSGTDLDLVFDNNRSVAHLAVASDVLSSGSPATIIESFDVERGARWNQMVAGRITKLHAPLVEQPQDRTLLAFPLFGALGGFARFDGVDDYATLDSYLSDNTETYEITFRHRGGGAGGYFVHFGTGTANDATQWSFQLTSSGYLSVTISRFKTTNIKTITHAFDYRSTPTMTYGVCLRISTAGALDDGVAELLVNGVLVGTATGVNTQIAPPAGVLTVGAGYGGNSPIAIDVRESRYWATLRTNTQVEQELNRYVPSAQHADLVAYHKFNDAAGTAVAATIGNNGVLVNGPTWRLERIAPLGGMCALDYEATSDLPVCNSGGGVRAGIYANTDAIDATAFGGQQTDLFVIHKVAVRVSGVRASVSSESLTLSLTPADTVASQSVTASLSTTVGIEGERWLYFDFEPRASTSYRLKLSATDGNSMALGISDILLFVSPQGEASAADRT